MTAAQVHFKSEQIRHTNQTRELESLSTLKQVIRLNVSQIFFGRKLYAEDAFQEFDIGGTTCKLLRYPNKYSCADKIIQHLEAAFEALEERYARVIELQISPKSEPNRIIERYTYVFDYGEKGDNLSVTLRSSSDDLTGNKDVVSLEESDLHGFKILSNTSSLMNLLAPLEGNFVVRFRLKYRPDAPADYAAPGFFETNPDFYQFRARRFKGSTVGSNFHKMALNCFIEEKLVRVETSEDDEEVGDSEAMSQQQSLDVIPDSQYAEQSGPFSNSFQVGSIAIIRCLCGISRNVSEMIVCAGCSSLHHGCCYRIIFEEDVPKKFYCSSCYKKFANGAYVDPSLVGLSIYKQQYIAIYRCAIYFIMGTPRVSVAKLMECLGISHPVAEAIIRSLLADDVLSEPSPDFIMNKNKLIDYAVPKYFYAACVDVPLLKKGVKAIEEDDKNVPVRKRVRFNIQC